MLLILRTSVSGQGLEPGSDPFGKPYRPTIGTLRPLVHPSVPQAPALELARGFYAGLHGNRVSRPFDVVDKSQLDDAEALAQAGSDIRDLRRYYYWASVGCHYLLRIEIIDWSMMDDVDSLVVPGSQTKRLVRHKVATANLSARLTDVSTSKILFYENFDLVAGTRDYDLFRELPDSARAMRRLYAICAQKGGDLLRDFLPAVAVVAAPHQLEKDKLHSFLVNDAPVTAYCRKGTEFKVFALYKTYQTDNQTFHHGEQVGRAVKSSVYTWKFPKYDVRSGRKEMAAALGRDATLVCGRGEFPLPAFLPSAGRTSLALSDFRNNCHASQRNLRILQDGCLEQLVARSQLMDAVDRDIYDVLVQEQNLQQAMRQDASQGGVRIGSELLVTATLEYLDKRVDLERSAQVAAQAKGNGAGKGSSTTKAGPARPAVSVPSKYRYTASATVQLQVTDVSTGEILLTKRYQVAGSADLPYSEANTFRRYQAEEASFRNMSQQLGYGIWQDIRALALPPLPLLDIAERDKKGMPSVLLVGGGTQAGLSAGNALDLVQLVTETVNGIPMTRDLVIGQLKLRDCHPATSLCTIKGTLSSEAAQALSAGKVYCRLKKD
ncbi:MAG: hypothetical protein RLY31_2797 [Bacteroidota bacterium]